MKKGRKKQYMDSKYALLLRLGLILVFFVVMVQAEQDTKEMRTLKLKLKEAQLSRDQAFANRESAEASLQEAEKLYKQGLYNKNELAQAQEIYRSAELDYELAGINLEKTRLAFLNDALYVNLEKASMYRDADGKKHVLLSIKNDSNIKKIIDQNGVYTDADKRALLTIENMSIRILLEGKLIGRPFETKIARLGYKQKKNVDFVLQRETESVTVEMTYADTSVLLPVFLEREAKEDHVLMEALQFSQEGELGARIAYEIELERFVDDNKTFTLDVMNLPDDFTYEFREKTGENNRDQRVSRIRFKKGVTTKEITLFVNMPKEISAEVLNEKLTFYVLALDRFAIQRLGDLKAKSEGIAIRRDGLDSANISYEILELIPRGRAELSITASNLFHKVKINDLIEFNFSLHNSGTVPLDRIRIQSTLPLDWSANVTPEKDIHLGVEGKNKIAVSVIPAPDVVAGDYEIKISAETMYEGREIEATAKTFRIQIEGKSNILAGTFLMIALIGMVVGVAVMTIKITRR